MNASNNILDRISAKTRERISVEMRQVPLSEIRRQAERVLQDSRDFSSHGGSFRRALARPGISFICEVKKASPSKGVIAEHFPYLDIAREYEAAGAAAPIAAACVNHPFVRGLADGSLSEERFLYYLGQNIHYLVNYRRALSALLSLIHI